MVPTLIVELYETDAAFDEATCEEAVVGEGGGSGFRAVEGVDVLGFL